MDEDRQADSVSARAQRLMAAAFARALDILLPPTCLKCDMAVARAGQLCGGCWGAIHFLSPPLCTVCGVPLEGAGDSGEECAACIAKPPPYASARAVLVYDEHSRALVTRFKYGDRTEMAQSFAGWMARAESKLIARCDFLAPVPLHRRRLLARRFNQAALIAMALGRRTGRPVVPDLLVRLRNTAPQVGLSLSARKRNVAHAFRVKPVHRSLLDQARVLLIDDVFTTGATVDACTRALLRAGAKRVDILTLARVVAPRQIGL